MKRNIYIVFVVVVFVFFELHTPLPSAEKGRILGRVTDQSGQPAKNVIVRLPQIKRETNTGGEGRFRFQNVPFGRYLITFQAVGFAARNRTIQVDNKEITVTVVIQPSSLETHTLTVTGTPVQQDPLYSAADIGIVEGRKKGENQGADLGQTLENLPGVTNIATGSQVGKPVIRGLSGNRIRVLHDEIAMNYQQYGVRHWANVDPLLSERIEVVRGAASVLYGSDALGGVINVIPRSIPFGMSDKPLLRGSLVTSYFSNNSELAGGLTLEGLSGNFGFTGTLIRRSGDNIHVPDVETASETGNSTDPKFTGELPYTDFSQLNGSLGVGYQSAGTELGIQYTRWTNEHNFLLPNCKGVGQNLENDVLNLNGLFVLRKNWILKSKFNYLQNLRQSNGGGSPRDRLPEDIVIDLLTRNYTGQLKLEHGKIGAFSGQMGIEYSHEDQDTRGVSPLVPDSKTSNFSAYVFEEASVGKFSFSLGARLDLRRQEAASDSRLFLPDPASGESDEVLKQEYSVFTGSIGASYQFTKNLTVAVNAGRGFRAPSIFELHVYGEHGGVAAFQIGNPHMKEELSLNTDLSLRWRSPGFHARITAHRNNIENYIYLFNTGEFYTKPDGSQIPIMNTTQGDARLTGLDMDLQAQVWSWLQISGTFEWVEGGNLESGEALPLLPATKAMVEARFLQKKIGPFQNCWLGIGFRHAWKKEAAGRYEPFWQFDLNQSFGVASTDAYTLLELGMGADIQLAGQPVVFSIKVRNATNVAYRDFLDTYKGYALSPGRSVQLRVEIPFNLLQKR